MYASQVREEKQNVEYKDEIERIKDTKARAIEEEDDDAIKKETLRSSQLRDRAGAGDAGAVRQLAEEAEIDKILETGGIKLAR